MKTTNQILILMAIISLMSCGQLHVVTLYVDTTQIDQSSIDQHASFGQPAGISNQDFKTNVRKGDRIIWQGVSINNPSDTVKITSINYVSGAAIIGPKTSKKSRSRLSSTTGTSSTTVIAPITNPPKIKIGSDEVVIGKIKMKPGNLKQYIEEKYSIDFTVTNKGTFQIDPVMRAYRK